MSDAVAVNPPATEPRKPLPPDVNNLLGAGWMAFGFAALMLVVLWPAMTGSWPAGISNFLLVAIIVGVALVGCFISYKVTKADPAVLSMGKWALLIGTVTGFVFLIIVLIMKFQEPSTNAGVAGVNTPNFFGPSPILSSSLLAVGALLPIFFAILALSMINRDGVREHFFPPEPEPVQTVETAAAVMEPEAVEAALADQEAALAEAAEDEVVTVEEEGKVEAEEPGDADKPHVPGDIDEPLSMGDLELFSDEDKKE